MLLNRDEMRRNNYVIPTAVLQKLLDAASTTRYSKHCSGCSSATELRPQVPNKLDLDLSEVVEVQSLLTQLVHLETSPSSSSSSSSDISRKSLTLDRPLQQLVPAVGVDGQRKPAKCSTVVVVNPARYKTELCRQYEEHGTCRYGDKCQFAHGGAELRSLARHPKYKTEMCRTFHTTGFCPYGLRCHFIHNDDERRGFVEAPGRRDAVTPVSAVSPTLLGPLPSDSLTMGHPAHLSRPIFRSPSSLSPTMLPQPEVDLEQRGRPILARSSTLPECSSPTDAYIIAPVNQGVTYSSVSGPGVLGHLAVTTVRAPCA